MAMKRFGDSVQQLGESIPPTGPTPPTAPRTVPHDLLVQSWGREMGRFALGIAVLTGFTLIGFAVAFSGSLGGGIVFLFACLMLWIIFGGAARRFHTSHKRREVIYRDGIVATGTVEQIRAVMTDTSTTRGNTTVTHIVHEVQWSFSVGGRRFAGSTHADSRKVAHLRLGDPIWLLVDPNDFTQSMEWPAGFVIAESTETTPQDRIEYVPQDHVEAVPEDRTHPGTVR